MEKNYNAPSRRNFIKKTTALATGLAGFSLLPQMSGATDYLPEEELHIIGPREGYSPQIGTMLSMMTWMRTAVLRSVKDMTREQLDYLHDPKSNTIGGMLLHLAATEKYYQLNTFDAMKWGSWDESIKKKWDIPMSLGDAGRQNIKGNDLSYYLDALKEVREKTMQEFKKRDDKWLMTVDPQFFGKQPTNNYCKWFHVCEHESNHNGQIKWIKSRLPGAKEGND